MNARGLQPNPREMPASGRAAQPATSSAANNEWTNRPPRNNQGELGPSTRNHDSPIMTATAAATAVNAPDHRLVTRDVNLTVTARTGAVANNAPSKRLLARVSVPMYPLVGLVTSNNLIIWASDSSEAPTQRMMTLRCTCPPPRHAIRPISTGQIR